jgi:hypothetical protein
VQQVTQLNRPISAVSSGNTALTSAARNLFVINLCAATSPVALARPEHAGLKRFIFFMSRRREEGRERFRLHMGYFDTQEEAERLLDIVREIYPGAWAGLAPGQRLRAVQPDAQAQAQGQPLTSGETTFASPEPEAARGEALPAPAPAPAPESAAPPTELALLPDTGRAIARQAELPDSEQDAAVRALSDVRAVIASLEDTGTSEDGVPSAATLRVIPELKPAPIAQGAAEISDSAALRVLEGSREALARGATAGAQPGEERPAFAVQLIWSVQPIDMTKIPELAIFSAYTLYGAEGNRGGRRWYGVRLGFFTDAVSAKQVAHYVRSDFSTVSVVPVTGSERERAKLAAAQAVSSPISTLAAPAAPAAPAALAAQGPIAKDNFEFIDDTRGKSTPLTRAATGRPGSGPPGKRAKFRSTRQVNGRAKAKPLTLEETLEILGADQLEIDDERAATINDTAGQRRAPERRRSSRLGRLLGRLSERLGT